MDDFCGTLLTERARVRLQALIVEDIADAVAAERERCLRTISEELARWNCGDEHYANVTKACDCIAKKIRSGD